MSLLLSSSLLLLLVNVFSEINEEQIPDGENVTEEFTQTRNRIYFPCWSSFSSSSALSLTSFLPSSSTLTSFPSSSFAFTSYFFVIFFSLFLTSCSFFFNLRLLRVFFIFLYFSTYFPYSLSLNDSSFTSPSYFFVAFFILFTSFFNLSLLLSSYFFFFFPPILRVLTNFF